MAERCRRPALILNRLSVIIIIVIFGLKWRISCRVHSLIVSAIALVNLMLLLRLDLEGRLALLLPLELFPVHLAHLIGGVGGTRREAIVVMLGLG